MKQRTDFSVIRVLVNGTAAGDISYPESCKLTNVLAVSGAGQPLHVASSAGIFTSR